MDAGDNTVLGVVVSQPGTDTPVEGNVVKDALHQTIQEDGQTQISNLTLGIVNVPTVSDNQRDNAISVRLTGSQRSEWTLQQDISFRNNMSEAIAQFCGQSDARLASCNLRRNQLNEINFQNIEILPHSPTQDADDSVLSFFVSLPDGATMPSDILNYIYSSSPNVISQPTVLNTTMSQNPVLTADQTENLVQLTINGLNPTQDVRLDVETTIANRLNAYCHNSGAVICLTNGTFTKNDVLVQIDPAAGNINFVVLNPQIGSSVPASSVQNAISGEFMSDLLGLAFTVPVPQENIDNAINVVLKEFQADQLSSTFEMKGNYCKFVIIGLSEMNSFGGTWQRKSRHSVSCQRTIVISVTFQSEQSMAVKTKICEAMLQESLYPPSQTHSGISPGDRMDEIESLRSAQ
ncbi:Hypothetical predicted protein [Paramuricea clavata]|uniref:Uncharacterized protein n=1 Tax=Paramuricea clavata TaxID=317549 RepID=A0A7D9HBG0_PARCT|nr:Hypothetical predicted protein [Paramuricea clavata]